MDVDEDVLNSVLTKMSYDTITERILAHHVLYADVAQGDIWSWDLKLVSE